MLLPDAQTVSKTQATHALVTYALFYAATVEWTQGRTVIMLLPDAQTVSKTQAILALLTYVHLYVVIGMLTLDKIVIASLDALIVKQFLVTPAL